MPDYFLFGKSRDNESYRLFFTKDYKVVDSISVESPDPKYIEDPNNRYLDGSID